MKWRYHIGTGIEHFWLIPSPINVIHLFLVLIMNQSVDLLLWGNSLPFSAHLLIHFLMPSQQMFRCYCYRSMELCHNLSTQNLAAAILQFPPGLKLPSCWKSLPQLKRQQNLSEKIFVQVVRPCYLTWCNYWCTDVWTLFKYKVHILYMDTLLLNSLIYTFIYILCFIYWSNVKSRSPK